MQSPRSLRFKTPHPLRDEAIEHARRITCVSWWLCYLILVVLCKHLKGEEIYLRELYQYGLIPGFEGAGVSPRQVIPPLPAFKVGLSGEIV